jgi:hypothetical protein
VPTGRRTLAALLVAACIPVSSTYAGGMPSPARLGQVGSPANFANAPLPDNVALDGSSLDIGSATAPRVVTVNPAVPAEIQHEADAYGTFFNQAIYTAPITVVPAGQSLTPVGCVYGSPPRACARTWNSSSPDHCPASVTWISPKPSAG